MNVDGFSSSDQNGHDPLATALDAPLCEACGSLDRMRPSGSARRAYWHCANCGTVSLS